jgi:hypothetical protein
MAANGSRFTLLRRSSRPQRARTSATRQDRDGVVEPDHWADARLGSQRQDLDVLTVVASREHSWHIDCEKCHLVVRPAHAGNGVGQVGPRDAVEHTS